MNERKQIIANRRWHLRILVKLFGTNGVATRSHKPNSHITAMAGPTPVRNIGNDTAKIMENTFRLKPGMLDEPPPKGHDADDPMIAEIVSVLTFATDADKQLILDLTYCVLRHSLRAHIDGPAMT